MSKKANYLDFLKAVEKSKTILRSGWIEKKISNPESIADHLFRVGILVMILSDKLGHKLDKYKLIEMTFLRGLGEVVTGDVVVERGNLVDLKKKEEKENQERKGINDIFGRINEAREYLAKFDEMVSRDTPEARIFWQLDNLEMAIQALEYENKQEINLEEFFLSASLKISHPMIKKIFNDIIKKRKKEYQESLAQKLGHTLKSLSG